MDILYRLEDMQELIGKFVYRLGVTQFPAAQAGFYNYQISPIEMEIKEIRLGRARPYNDSDFYGSGSVSLVCYSSKYDCWQAFSPTEDELLLSNQSLFDRLIRGALKREELLEEAKILKRSIWRCRDDVARVEICFERFHDQRSLDHQIAVADEAQVFSAGRADKQEFMER